MRSIVRLAARILVGAGWMALIGGAMLIALERSGLARRLLVEVLEARLGALGSSLEVDGVEFHWLEPALELRGLSLADGRELLAIERLRASFGFSPRHGATLKQLTIDGGRVEIGARLVNGFRGLFDGGAAPEPGARPSSAGRPWPRVQVRALDLALEGLSGDAFPLGRLELSTDGGAELEQLVRGRILLPRRAAALERPTLHLSGRWDRARRLELRVGASELRLEDIELPAGERFDLARALEPRGRLALEGDWHIDLFSAAPSAGGIRAALRELSLRPVPGQAPFQDLALDFEGRFEPEPGDQLYSAHAWIAGARWNGHWDGRPLRGGARIGRGARAGFAFETWTRFPELAVDAELVELAGTPKFLSDVWQATRPEGRFDLILGLRCRDGWRPGAELSRSLELLAGVQGAGEIAAAWHGIPPSVGRPRVGFPMPVVAEHLRVVYARTARIPRPELLGVEVRGRHGSGPVEARYSSWSPPIDSPPFAPGARKAEEELLVSSPRVALDATLEAAAARLESSPLIQSAFATYAPRDGRAAVELRLSDRRSLAELATHVRVELHGAGATWSELPVPAREVAGEIEYRADGLASRAVRFDLRGELEGADALRLRGRLREDPEPAVPGAREAPRPESALEVIELEVAALSLTGAAREAVADRWSGVGAALAGFGPLGHADLRVARVRGAPRLGHQTDVVVVPKGDVTLRPAALPVTSRDVRGRVLARGSEPPRGADGSEEARWETLVSPLVATWPGSARVAMSASFPPEEASRVLILGAGLRASDEELRGELERALSTPENGAGASGLDGIVLRGALDFESVLAGVGADGEERARHLFHLRRNSFAGGPGLALERIEGKATLDGGRVRSERLIARLGATALELRGTELGFDGAERRLSTTLVARGVPLDRDHLWPLLDERTLAILIEEFEWRGRVDVPGWELEWRSSPEGGERLALRGDLTLTDVHVEIGVPLSIGSASGRIHELVIENGVVRAFGVLYDMYGELVGRELGPAEVLVSHYGSRLSLESFDGTFVRGALRGPDHDAVRTGRGLWPGPVLSMELEPPFPFQLALELDDVDVEQFLRDLFPSNIADKGRLSGELRLHGDLDDLLSIRGSGYGELRNSRLWSIPVFRDLFSQLGFEETAVFDQMRTRFALEGGVVTMRDIEVKSPILKLVGQGTLDLDGTLSHDFQVHYSVVDRLGILKQPVYLVQNSLLSVSIRGDMSRPEVILRGALTALFRPVRDQYRSLPLPEYGALPPRF